MNNKWWKYGFPVVYGLIIYTSIRLVNDVISDTKFWLRPFITNAIELITVVIGSYIFDAIVRYFLRKNQQKNSSSLTTTLLLKEFIEVALYLELGTTCILIPMAALVDDGLQWYDVVNLYLIPLLYLMLYYAIARGNASAKDL